MCHRLASIIAILALLLAPGAAASQPLPTPNPDAWRTFAQRLPPGQFVSVRLLDGAQFKGTLVTVGDADCTIQPRTRIPVALRTVRYADVAAMEPQKRPMSAGRKVVTGVGIGFGAYMVLIAALIAGGALD